MYTLLGASQFRIVGNTERRRSTNSAVYTYLTRCRVWRQKASQGTHRCSGRHLKVRLLVPIGHRACETQHQLPRLPRVHVELLETGEDQAHRRCRAACAALSHAGEQLSLSRRREWRCTVSRRLALALAARRSKRGRVLPT